MYVFSVLLGNQRIQNRLFCTKKEFGRTFLPVCYVQTTRKVVTFYPKSAAFHIEKQGQKRYFFNRFCSLFFVLFSL